MIALLVASLSLTAQQPAPAKLKLVQEVRIDGAAEDISSIGSAVVMRDGRIAFFEPQDSRVRIYDVAGREIAKFGRRGEGPGEFGYGGPDRGSGVVPLRLGSLQLRLGMIGDTLWVFNARRFTLISRDGKLIRTVSQPAVEVGARLGASTQTLVSFEAQAMLDGSNMMGVARVASDGARPSGRGAGQSVYVVAAANGAIIRTLADVTHLSNFVSVSGGGAAVPFVEGTYESIAPDGSRFAIGSTTISSTSAASLRIVVIASTGDTLFTRDHAFTPVAIAPRSLDSAIATRMAAAQTLPTKGQLESALRAAVPKAASLYRGLIVGSDYSIWIESKARPDGRDYLVLDERGAMQGTVALGKNARLLSATKSVMWTVETDANDLPSLVRYRLNK